MKGPRPKDPALRFAPKVAHDEATGCWVWTGVKSPKGYGQFAMKVGGKWRPVAAHRWAYLRWNDVIPDGLDLDHLCRNRACVNPWHLEPVTPSENSLRGLRGRLRATVQTHCSSGHAFAGDNLRIERDGHYTRRICIICSRARARERTARYRARKKETV